MPRELADGIFWIQECYDSPALREKYSDDPPDWYNSGEKIHVCDNAFLICGNQTLLFDTLSPHSTNQILDELDSLLDGQDLDYLVISHPENPHAGNTFPILEEHPGAELIAPEFGSKHGMYHLEDATKVAPGETIDLGGKIIEFVEPTFLDHRVHTWLAEHVTETLFTVDWLGDVHMEKNCLDFLDELDNDDPVSRQVEFHSRALFWFQYVDETKTRQAIESLIDVEQPNVVAPAHGVPVREETEEYLRLNNAVIDRIIEQGRIMSAY
ncbi:MBL fold metallo-hydrolase [Halorarum salinum]|uniref:MBL fold metallo-hydrolase n=1 Tax=Halorarum salinum TaxID=2743089 RepID=A0A7D5QAN8_9EURY|nr:MBL fold metallo-hydrolase [Halobaculum salinum]QLG61918.1 MBL fold metallo-hydrolase [Halobaculum salinum]